MAVPKHTYRKVSPQLKANIGTIALDNPTILASGVLGVAAGGLISAYKGGAGAVVTKTVGIKPREGYPGPRIVGLYGNNLMNAMGIPNPGISDYLPEIQVAIKHGIPVIGSVFGDTPNEFFEVTKRLLTVGVKAIELNLSCPHVGSLYLLGLNPKGVSQVVRKVIDQIGDAIPVWVKLPGSTDYPLLVKVAQTAEKAGAKAIVALNTLPALAIDSISRKPLLGAGIGGLSGPAIKPIALRAVWELKRAGISIPIIGVGGILTGEDVIEYLLAGASAVQIGTGVLTRGTTVFHQICDEILEYLKLNQIKQLAELIGRIDLTGANIL